jgi:hypothetical protein
MCALPAAQPHAHDAEQLGNVLHQVERARRHASRLLFCGLFMLLSAMKNILIK